jgi:hypothetical protein
MGSLPAPVEDVAAAAVLRADSSQHGADLLRPGGGLRALLPSARHGLAAAFGLGAAEHSFTQAPAFAEAAASFHQICGSDWGSSSGRGGATQPAGAAASSQQQPAQDQRPRDQQQQQQPAQGQEQPEQQQLVRLFFATHSPSGSSYRGVDVEVVLRLSSLAFYCNRPTVAALMVFGTDLSTVNSLLAGPPADAEQVRRWGCIAVVLGGPHARAGGWGQAWQQAEPACMHCSHSSHACCVHTHARNAAGRGRWC